MKKAHPTMSKHVRSVLAALALAPLAAGAQPQSDAKAGNGSTQAAASRTQGGSGQTAAQGAGGQAVPAAAFVLVPVVPVARDPLLKNGCWARLYDNQGFSGDMLTVSGPIDMPHMIGPFGIDWQGKVSSLETGPKTTLTIFDNDNYRDPVSTFKPGMRVADVSKRLGFFDQMRSLKMSCTK